MKLDSLQDVYVTELRDLYSAESQLIDALPRLAKAASSPSLREAFESHLDETKDQLKRLEGLFERLGESPKGRTCQAMKGLIAESAETIAAKSDDPAAHDAALICAAQKIEHYEIAGYGCVRTFARLLGQTEAADLLQETLDEEGEADAKLSAIAENIVNPQAGGATDERALEREEGEGGGVVSTSSGDVQNRM